jgi:formylmethanofuran dehydrogenase subunit E
VAFDMGVTKRNREQDLDALLKAAASLHGHFGPFLTLGVRMGLTGLREIGAKEGDTQLRITVSLEYVLPFSCILDGIQTATKCTVGNQRLSWRESKELGAMFLLETTGRQIEVKVNQAVVRELSRRLDKRAPMSEAVRQLASEVASRSEKELFSVIRK